MPVTSLFSQSRVTFLTNLQHGVSICLFAKKRQFEEVIEEMHTGGHGDGGLYGKKRTKADNRSAPRPKPEKRGRLEASRATRATSRYIASESGISCLINLRRRYPVYAGGNTTLKSAPPSGASSKLMVPPWASMAMRLIESPSPVPPLSRERPLSSR